MVVVIIDQRMVMFKWLIIMCKIFNNMMPQVEGLCYIAELSIHEVSRAICC